MDSTKIIQGGLSTDDRGTLRFVNDFNFSDVKRFYQVENHNRNFIRAFHGHIKEGKYVYVAKGTALVVAIPIINVFDPYPVSGSHSYVWHENNAYDLDRSKIEKFTLSASQPRVLYIPPGYANGFKNLTDDTVILFFSTSTLEESKGDDIRFDWDSACNWSEGYR